MSPSPPRTRRLLKRLLLVATILLVADQLLLHTVFSADHLGGRYLAPFDPPLFTSDQRARVSEYRVMIEQGAFAPGMTSFDPELGWCPRPGKLDESFAYDERGCRLGGEPLSPGKSGESRRVVAVGCSFTHGDEVRGEETWAAQLDAARPDLEIANLGVGGYGLDQALLRYRRDGAPLEPDEVWMGFYPGASWRVVTCYAPACRHWTQMVLFKPRFFLEESGELRLVPSPAPDLETVVRLLSDQGAFLEALGENDLWIRRAPLAYAPRGTSILHHSAVGRLALTAAEAGGRDTEAEIEDPRSEVHRVTRGLILAARDEATARGARFRLLVLPSRADLYFFSEAGSAYWGPLIESLRVEGVTVHDLAPALIEAGVHEDAEGWRPQGHYSPDTNRIVAETLSARVLADPE